MMISDKTKLLIRRYGIFYFIGFIICFGIKYFYSRAGSDGVDWILAPTARWVSALSGITFEKVPRVGYINHQFRFIIAASCSGIQFMLVTFATLIFSFVHLIRTMWGRFCWVALSLGFSYLFTIIVNGFRITLSIYLPLFLYRTNIISGFATPERLHTILGAAIYFTSLFILYKTTGRVFKTAGMTEKNKLHFYNKYQGKPLKQTVCGCIPPVFWYFSITLGIPFLNGAYKNDSGKFMEYAIIMAAVCFATVFLFCFASAQREHTEIIR